MNSKFQNNNYLDHKESPLTKKHEKDTKSINLDEINEIEEDSQR